MDTKTDALIFLKVIRLNLRPLSNVYIHAVDLAKAMRCCADVKLNRPRNSIANIVVIFYLVLRYHKTYQNIFTLNF